MAIERDELEVLGGVRFGVTLGSPVAVLVRNTEWPRWRDEMSPEPGDSRHRPRSPRPDPVMPTSPGCRSTTPMTPETSWSEPRRGRRRPGPSPATWRGPCSKPSGCRCSATSSPSARRSPRTVPSPPSADLDTIDSSPVRAFDRRGGAGDGRRHRSRPCRAGHAGRGGRGPRLRRSHRPGEPRPLGSPARRPAGRGADVDPGHQGGRDRRRARLDPAARLGRPRRDRARRRWLHPRQRTGPVASRAGCRSAAPSGCGPP